MQTKWIKLDPLIMVVISSIKSTHFGLLFCCYFQVVLHFGDPSFCLLFTLLCTGISYFAAMMIANNQRRTKILMSSYVEKTEGIQLLFFLILDTLNCSNNIWNDDGMFIASHP